MNYYERHIGDYLKDTAHLSLLEHGVYGRLLDVYYTREGAIPVEQCERLIGARSKDERAALAAVLDEFFTVADGMLHHSRCDREIARYQDKQRKAAASANARWKRADAHSDGNANASPDAMRTHSEGNAPNHQTPDTTTASKMRREGAKGSRLPDEWEPGDEGRQFALTLGIAGARFDSEAARFCDYWRAQPGAKGRKSDWPATWRNWCRNAMQRAGTQGQARDTEPEWRREQRERNEAYLGPAAARRSRPNTIDMEPTDATPDLLG